MKKNVYTAALLTMSMLGSTLSYADMIAMDNQDLQSTQGQGAATINWELSLNTNKTTVNNVDTFSFDTTTCSLTNIQYCRLGISANNRYDNNAYLGRDGKYYKADGSTGAVTDLGKKQWVVFKGMQGYIKFQNVELDGTDVIYKSKSNTDVLKTGIQLAFDSASPILIRNLGFNAVKIETDTVANEGPNNLPGYLATGTYTTPGFDYGRETGFTGLAINSNVAMQGTLKVFGCNTDHPRC